jgi:ATP-dependent Clp protease ATP-binding subunit ClpB
MDNSKFTIKSQEVISYAQEIAIEKGNPTIDTGHLLFAILNKDQDVTPYLLSKMGINTGVLQSATGKIIEAYPKVTGGQLYASQALNGVFQQSLVFRNLWGMSMFQ